jgi:hypothetical protein
MSSFVPAGVLFGAALGLLSGIAIGVLRFRPPKPPEGG